MHAFKYDLKRSEILNENPDCLVCCDTLQLGVTCFFHPHFHLNTGKRNIHLAKWKASLHRRNYLF